MKDIYTNENVEEDSFKHANRQYMMMFLSYGRTILKSIYDKVLGILSV